MADYPWFKHYDAGVPRTLEPYPDKTLFEDVADVAKERPGHRMIWFKGRWMSYKEIDHLSDVLAAGLAAIGVKKGDRVAMLMPNSPNIVIGQLAIWKAGAISVPVNPLYSEGELEFALKECGAEVAIVLTAYYDVVKKIQPRTSLRLLIATSIKEYLAPFMKIMFTLLMEKKQGQYLEKVQGNDIWLQDLMKKHAGDKKPDVKVTGKDTGLLLFSGGTTGTPKGVMLSHEAIFMNGRQIHCLVQAAGHGLGGYAGSADALLPCLRQRDTAVHCHSRPLSHRADSQSPRGTGRAGYHQEGQARLFPGHLGHLHRADEQAGGKIGQDRFQDHEVLGGSGRASPARDQEAMGSGHRRQDRGGLRPDRIGRAGHGTLPGQVEGRRCGHAHS